MPEISNLESIEELERTQEALKVLAVSLSSIRTIDAHELSKELNEQIYRARPYMEGRATSSKNEQQLIDDINHLAQTCLQMIRVRENLETCE